nr:MAG TPA: hypothetical protein [Caudoviricetes sp.]
MLLYPYPIVLECLLCKVSKKYVVTSHIPQTIC